MEDFRKFLSVVLIFALLHSTLPVRVRAEDPPKENTEKIESPEDDEKETTDTPERGDVGEETDEELDDPNLSDILRDLRKEEAKNEKERQERLGSRAAEEEDPLDSEDEPELDYISQFRADLFGDVRNLFRGEPLDFPGTLSVIATEVFSFLAYKMAMRSQRLDNAVKYAQIADAHAEMKPYNINVIGAESSMESALNKLLYQLQRNMLKLDAKEAAKAWAEYEKLLKKLPRDMLEGLDGVRAGRVKATTGKFTRHAWRVLRKAETFEKAFKEYVKAQSAWNTKLRELLTRKEAFEALEKKFPGQAENILKAMRPENIHKSVARLVAESEKKMLKMEIKKLSGARRALADALRNKRLQAIRQMGKRPTGTRRVMGLVLFVAAVLIPIMVYMSERSKDARLKAALNSQMTIDAEKLNEKGLSRAFGMGVIPANYKVLVSVWNEHKGRRSSPIYQVRCPLKDPKTVEAQNPQQNLLIQYVFDSNAELSAQLFDLILEGFSDDREALAKRFELGDSQVDLIIDSGKKHRKETSDKTAISWENINRMWQEHEKGAQELAKTFDAPELEVYWILAERKSYAAAASKATGLSREKVLEVWHASEQTEKTIAKNTKMGLESLAIVVGDLEKIKTANTLQEFLLLYWAAMASNTMLRENDNPSTIPRSQRRLTYYDRYWRKVYRRVIDFGKVAGVGSKARLKTMSYDTTKRLIAALAYDAARASEELDKDVVARLKKVEDARAALEKDRAIFERNKKIFALHQKVTDGKRQIEQWKVDVKKLQEAIADPKTLKAEIKTAKDVLVKELAVVAPIKEADNKKKDEIKAAKVAIAPAKLALRTLEKKIREKAKVFEVANQAVLDAEDALEAAQKAKKPKTELDKLQELLDTVDAKQNAILQKQTKEFPEQKKQLEALKAALETAQKEVKLEALRKQGQEIEAKLQAAEKLLKEARAKFKAISKPQAAIDKVQLKITKRKTEIGIWDTDSKKLAEQNKGDTPTPRRRSGIFDFNPGNP